MFIKYGNNAKIIFGLLSAAMTDRVDSAGLQRRGVRLSASSLYKSGFRGISRQRSTVDLSMK